MATAMQEKAQKANTPSDDGSGRGGGRFQVHKPGEGYATRLATFVIAMLFVAYTCHHWFYGWTFLRGFFDRMLQALHLRVLGWSYDPVVARYVAFIGVAVLLVAGGLASFYFIYVRVRSAEFLVKTDGELAKVTWPKITPWFKPEAKVWGATYVVLIVLALLTVYIMVVDQALVVLSRWLFYVN
jgi:preprotein translocase subunit SecE